MSPDNTPSRARTDALGSSPKQVTFEVDALAYSAPPSPTPSTSSSPALETPQARPRPPAPVRRRSSMKEGAKMPCLPQKDHYQHKDPLLRRLRLRNRHGDKVSLEREFAEAEVVLFLFGANTSTYSGRDNAYTVVDDFARKKPHRLRVVYVPMDEHENGFRRVSQGKSWLNMEWRDGSNDDQNRPTLSPAPSPPVDPPNGKIASESESEPFLLANDTDLEADMHLSDPAGSLYLRPFSRIFLAEYWQILAVPTLVVYHVGQREILSRNARIESLRGEGGEEAWRRWQAGEKGDWAWSDLVRGAKWTFALGAVGASYLVVVRYGAVDDVVRQVSEHLTRGFLGSRR